ncbi:MAG: PD-(D/E)XK nuclease family protein [Bacteroidales bacterium]|jgi:hypothetical protein|nr:PD-(D/E)XK nuclease family protein [Bacteroidales bacterium]
MAELEKFIEQLNDSQELKRFVKEIKEFEPFRMMNINGKETTHSRILAYLLETNYSASNSFWSNFCKELKSLYKQENQEIWDDLKDAKYPQIYTEYSFDKDSENTESENKNFLDLFITTEDTAIVIENKIYAAEGDNQIGRYQNYLETERSEKNKIIVFLTLNGNKPTTAKEKSEIPVICISWSKIYYLILQSFNEVENTFVSLFRNHLYKNLVMKNEIEDTCYKFYEENKEEYELLANNLNYCKRKQTIEWFEKLENEINKKYSNSLTLNIIDEEKNTGKGKFTLTIKKEKWKDYNISIKIYRHDALGIFPCIEHIKKTNEFAIQKEYESLYISKKSFDLGINKVFYFSKTHFHIKKRWVHENPIFLTIDHHKEVLRRLELYILEIDEIVKKNKLKTNTEEVN